MFETATTRPPGSAKFGPHIGAARPPSTSVAQAVGVASHSMARQHSMATADVAGLRMGRPANLMIVNSVASFDTPA